MAMRTWIVKINGIQSMPIKATKAKTAVFNALSNYTTRYTPEGKARDKARL